MGFNRYMVECEYSEKVKNLIWSHGFNRYMVECEFCFKYGTDSAGPCFNRYMVECELFTMSNLNMYFFVLIDTWWNVNL